MPPENGHDTFDPLIKSYEEQIQDLKTQLEKAKQRETVLIEERAKLIEERKEPPALMPPPPVDNGAPSWWDRLNRLDSNHTTRESGRTFL